MTVYNTEEFQSALTGFLTGKIREFTRDWEEGERGPGPSPRYVVRAETDAGSLYLRSLTGSMTEWTSEQRYAQRYGLEEARENRDNAFCPDARSFHVRKLRPSPGYHIAFNFHESKLLYVEKSFTYDGEALTVNFDRRKLFKTKSDALKWIDRIRYSGYESNRARYSVVPELPERPESVVPVEARDPQ